MKVYVRTYQLMTFHAKSCEVWYEEYDQDGNGEAWPAENPKRVTTRGAFMRFIATLEFHQILQIETRPGPAASGNAQQTFTVWYHKES